jgi:acid phosphatase type 7
MAFMSQTKKMRKWTLALVIGVGIAAISICLYEVRLQRPGGLLGGPMVQSLGMDRFSLVWWEPGAGRETVNVHALNDPHGRQIFVAPEQGWYRANIDGLTPNTYYLYEITKGTGAPCMVEPACARGRTRTAPAPGGAFRFLAFGDSGSGHPEQYQLAKVMRPYDPDLIIHTGDVIQPDGSLSGYPKKFFRPYEDLLERACVYPCLGNHDWDDTAGGPYLRVFCLPSNGPAGLPAGRNYWFDFGDVRFVCLDSNDTSASLENNIAPWLDGVLQDAPTRWKIVFFHHPVCTNGRQTPKGAILQHIMPVIDRHDVDLVLAGHNHMYERSVPMRNGQIAREGRGTVHITTGAGGCPLHGVQGPKPDFLVTANNTEYSFTVVDVTPETLSFQQVSVDRNVIDRFVINKPAARAPASGSQ